MSLPLVLAQLKAQMPLLRAAGRVAFEQLGAVAIEQAWFKTGSQVKPA